ncbi:MAG: tetratricopeptide repeat protein [Chitinophagaceae bacterium]|nr:tetratricopeptide repeat protein [Chitinophagaceae bacterium]
MKKLLILCLAWFTYGSLAAQPDEVKMMYEIARTFMRSGDFNNAVIVLQRAIQKDPSNLELMKDLTMSLYLKRDYQKALDVAEKLTDRDDADEVCFQMAGNVYKALEQPKECDKLYKKALKKFPKSGPLYSEYGELLWSTKDYAAIDKWEKGIEVDPAYGGNYYNAALYYFFVKDKVWSLIYGEIFVNMESLSERGAAMKQLLLQGYKEKLFADVDLMQGQEKNKSEFARTFLETMNRQASLANQGLTTEVLTMIRTRFILEWYNQSAAKFPFKLFDFQQQLLKAGMFNAYNQWLFGPNENLAAYENWTKTHAEEYKSFENFQKSRVFKMPAGQYYQVR